MPLHQLSNANLPEQVVDVDVFNQVADNSTEHNSLDMWLNLELNHINYIETFSASVPVITEPTLPYDSERWDSWIDWATGEPPRESRIIRDDSISINDVNDSGNANIVPERSSAEPTPLLSLNVVNVDDDHVQMTTESNIWSQYSPGKFSIQWPESVERAQTLHSDSEGLSEHSQPLAGHPSLNSSLPTPNAVINKNTIKQKTPEFASYSFYPLGTSEIAWPTHKITTNQVPDNERAESTEVTPPVHRQSYQTRFSNGPQTPPRTAIAKEYTSHSPQKTPSQASVVEKSNSPVRLVYSNLITSSSLKRKPACDFIVESESTPSPPKYRGRAPHNRGQRLPTSTLVTSSPPHYLSPSTPTPFVSSPPDNHTHILAPSTSPSLLLPPTFPIPAWKTIPRNDPRRIPPFISRSKQIFQCTYTGPAVGGNGCRALISPEGQNINNHLAVHVQEEESMVLAGLLGVENVHAMLWAKKTPFRCSISGCGYYTEKWQLKWPG
ncbi:hypothetical protein Clacol_007877 [Clathrus columnatus]|uniref:Uncharacterized protein n=1 Tax=Clathrus columnatus TaxID=1419009 RepID=A0AAV5AG52_9AGAM|nr:hypothetical protein Clacol_007877 [Clathrus columnatus]